MAIVVNSPTFPPDSGVVTAAVVVDSPIFGTNGDDILRVHPERGTPRYNPDTSYYGIRMFGFGGNDQLVGGHGDDQMYGDSGSDTFIGGYGNDRIDGGTGNDTVDYTNILGRSGGGGGHGGYGYGHPVFWHNGFGVRVNLEFGTGETLDTADRETDTLISIENVLGTNWTDVIQGSEGANLLDGRGGNDYLFGWGGRDHLKGGDGEDWLSGGDGNDRLEGGLGNDKLRGDAGHDTADYGYSTQGMIINLATGVAFAATGDSDTLNQIESVAGSERYDIIIGDDGSNTLSGRGSGDFLSGGLGVDFLFGGSGNDVMDGGAGGDLLSGDSGTDEVLYDDSPAAIRIDLVLGTGLGGMAQGDILFEVENIAGSAFSDILYGNSNDNEFRGFTGNDRMSGREGSDELDGGEGDDDLDGGDGDDALLGGAGADILRGGAGIDLADYHFSAAGVNVNLLTGTASGGDAAGDVLTAVENLTGSTFADTLRISATGDRLDGGGGDDLLTGNALGNQILGGAGNDRVDANAGADYVEGGEGADRVDGGIGNDTLYGGLGADALTGGSGGDTFLFHSVIESPAGAGRDRITDFVSGEDRIELGHIDAIISLATVNDAFTFIGAAAFTPGVAGELRAIVSGGNTIIQGETYGTLGPDFEIILTGVHALNAGDFLL